MFCSIVRKRAKKLAVHGSSKMAVKVWFHKTVFSDNTKEVSFKLNRLFVELNVDTNIDLLKVLF